MAHGERAPGPTAYQAGGSRDANAPWHFCDTPRAAVATAGPRPLYKSRRGQLIDNAPVAGSNDMTVPTQSIIDTRRHQMFPVLEPAEIERVRRFGEVRSYGAGEALAKVGDRGHGLTIILAGKVDITQHDESGRREPIVTHGARRVHGRAGATGGPAGPGGRPRAGAGGGLDHSAGPAPGIARCRGGARRADHARPDPASRRPAGDRRRRAGDRRPRRERRCASAARAFSAATAIRINGSNPETDPEAKALIERFHVDPGQLPIVLCPGGQLLRNPSETELARCIGLVGPIDPEARL